MLVAEKLVTIHFVALVELAFVVFFLANELTQVLAKLVNQNKIKKKELRCFVMLN